MLPLSNMLDWPASSRDRFEHLKCDNRNNICVKSKLRGKCQQKANFDTRQV